MGFPKYYFQNLFMENYKYTAVERIVYYEPPMYPLSNFNSEIFWLVSHITIHFPSLPFIFM